jgi:plastocyanin
MNSARGISTAILVVVTALGAAACGGSSTSYGSTGSACSAATAVATTTVSIQGMTFSPSCIKVAAGATVTFTNHDAIAHTVTADDSSYNSGDLAPGATFTHVYAVAGSYPYHCLIHPGMTGSVVAQ